MKSALGYLGWTVICVVAALILFESVHLFSLKHDVSVYKKYWQQRTNENQNAAITYIALGDSGAQSIGASQPSNGYVGQIADALTLKNQQQIRVINLSVSGAKVDDVIDRQLPQLQKLNIKDNTIITLEIGANDMKHFNEAVFTQQIKELFAQLPKQTIVAEVPYFGSGVFKNREPHAARATNILREAAEEQHLRVAPLYSVSKANNNLTYFAADGFHPNDKGYTNWYQAFKAVLDL